MNKCLIITISIIVLMICSSILVSCLTYPKPAKDISVGRIDDRATYLKKIYQSAVSPATLSGLIKDSNLNWIWDTAPTDVLKNFPIAENLSFIWPPKKGSRYRLTAFPYPDTGKSSWWLIQFIKGMASLLDNTKGQVTFPGWQVSIYDPVEPNFNSWRSFLKQGDHRSRPSDLGDHRSRPSDLGVQTTQIAMEVTHACYAPPKKSYPVCDDGGYWLYGASGSGVFWWSCNDKGKYLVCNNKIDAIFKLWDYAKSLGEDTGKKALANMLLATGLDYSAKAEDYIMARLKGTGGGMSLMAALKKFIDIIHSGKQISPITAWRSMEPSNAKSGWTRWVTILVMMIIIWLTGVGGLIYMIYLSIRDRHDRKWQISVLIILGIVLALVGVGYLFARLEWSVASENLLQSFGYTTLDMALAKSKLNLKEFIFSSAGIDSAHNDLPVGKYNPITNGLAQTQVFDFDLSYLTSTLKLDSVIMHAQPNKSGSWAVEILDVRNTPATGAKSLDDLIFSLGLCGQPLKGAEKMKQLEQGPIEAKPGVYFGYQPTAPCDCDDADVAKKYNKGKGTLKKCVFCKGSLSEQLC